MVFKWFARVQLTRAGVLAVVLTAAAPIATAQSPTADSALASALREAWRRGYRLGLGAHLTPQRSNGLRSMVERIKADARAALQAA